MQASKTIEKIQTAVNASWKPSFAFAGAGVLAAFTFAARVLDASLTDAGNIGASSALATVYFVVVYVLCAFALIAPSFTFDCNLSKKHQLFGLLICLIPAAMLTFSPMAFIAASAIAFAVAYRATYGDSVPFARFAVACVAPTIVECMVLALVCAISASLASDGGDAACLSLAATASQCGACFIVLHSVASTACFSTRRVA